MSRTIKIMHVVLSLEVGGLESLVVELVRRMRHNYQFLICCLDSYGELSKEAEELGAGIKLLKRKPGIDLLLPFRLAKLMSKEGVSIVHTHNLSSLFYGSLAGKIAGIPVILSTQHGRKDKGTRKSRWADRLAACMNNKVIAVSQDTADWLRDYYGIHSSKIEVIYNGIDIKQYAKQDDIDKVRKLLKIEPGTSIVGTVARLSPEKDQITLLNAFSQVLKRINKVKLLIAGDGVLGDKLREYAERLGLSDNVLFLGYRKDIPSLLSMVDVFVLSSLREGVSLTLLEAMAADTPIVATDVGGNSEVVIEGETGFLTPAKSPDKMADAIIKILSEKELAGRMAEAGQRRVEEIFDIEQMVKKYDELYRFYLGGKRNILIFTSVFPNSIDENKGLRMRIESEGLSKEFGVKVVAPYPWVLFLRRYLSRSSKFQFKAVERQGDIEVFRPIFVNIPKIGRFLSGFLYFLSALKTVLKIRKSFKFDLIISYWAYPDGFAALLFSKMFRVPLIIRPRGSDINILAQERGIRGFIKLVLRSADKVIPVSGALRDKIIELGIVPDKLRVISSGVDRNIFKAIDKQEARKLLGVTNGHRLVLFVGNLVEVKGIDYLIKAMHLLSAENSRDISLNILGSGSLRQSLDKMIADLRLQDIVKMAGEISNQELSLWMNASDVFCLPSLNEGWPNVLMEALACGTPVVATDVGGIPEIINDRELGILIPPKSPEMLAQGIKQAFDKEWDRNRLVSRVSSSDWADIVRQVSSECNELFGGGNER
ncbi:MAG: glycosyltransferase [Candidatus Omnitrophota bacterium]